MLTVLIGSHYYKNKNSGWCIFYIKSMRNPVAYTFNLWNSKHTGFFLSTTFFKLQTVNSHFLSTTFCWSLLSSETGSNLRAFEKLQRNFANLRWKWLCETCSRFHQHFTGQFFVQKRIEQLFSIYVWLWNFLQPKILAKKLSIKCWWNWLLNRKFISSQQQQKQQL